MMKILKPQSAIASMLAAMAILTFSAGCKKGAGYHPDYNNSYINATPTSGGGEAQPVLSSFSPGQGLPNTVIRIAGLNFDPSLANNTVTINGTAATVDAATSTAIYITVPANATSGPLVLKTGAKTVSSTVDFKVLTSTSSIYASLNTNIEHISFNDNGWIIGETTSGVYHIQPSGSAELYSEPGYQFGSLWGSAAYHNEEVYVTDRIGLKILRITPEGVVGELAGSSEGIVDGPGKQAQFASPTGLALDLLGNVYTTDTRRIRKINSSGVVKTIAGGVDVGNVDGLGSLAQFGNLQGIAVGPDTAIYVTDRQFLNIRRITQAGLVTTFAGSGTKGMVDGDGKNAQFVDPFNIAIDYKSGNMVVADGNSTTGYAIRLVNKFGQVSTLLSGQILNAPDGMTFDPQGDLFIANTGAHNIIKLTIQ